MDDQELISEFIAVERNSTGCSISVLTIRWDGPANPVSIWIPVRNLPADFPVSAIQSEIARLLEDPQYFAVCEECHERNPVGWMDDERICQSCAERNHGVVH